MVVCVRCGHEESEGVWYAASDGDAGADTVHVERALAERREAGRALLDRLDFPVYALASAAAKPALGGWGSQGTTITSVSLRHGEQVEIETDRDTYDPAVERVRRALIAMLPGPNGWPDVSPPALTVWLSAREREGAAIALRAEHFEAELPVDRAPVRFTGVRTGGAWAAVADTGAVRITIAARDLPAEEVALRRVDPRELDAA